MAPGIVKLTLEVVLDDDGYSGGDLTLEMSRTYAVDRNTIGEVVRKALTDGATDIRLEFKNMAIVR